MRFYGVLAALVVILGCAIGLLARAPVESVADSRVVLADFRRLEPGITQASQLPQLGFNLANGERLSYLGVVEKLMPGDSSDFDALDPAVRECFQTADRCAAFVFPLADRTGLQAVVVIQAGRVAFKSLSGKMVTSAAIPLPGAARD